MEFLSVLILREKTEDVVSHLVSLGLFQPADIRNIEKDLEGLSLFEVNSESAQRQALEIQLSDLLRKLSLKASPIKNIEIFSYEKIEELFRKISQQLNNFITAREELSAELNTKESMFMQVKDYLLFPIKRNSFYSILDVRLGKLEEKSIQIFERSLEGLPHLIYPVRKAMDKTVVLFIGLRRDRALLDKVFKGISWESLELPNEYIDISEEVEKKLKIQIDECLKKIAEINAKIKNLADVYQEDLSKAQAFLKLKKSLLEAKKYSCVTSKTVLLSGWVPSEEKQKVMLEIKKIADVSYAEGRPASQLDIPKEDIPVRLKHNVIFKPFEFLISNYGVPRYGTIDPTIFIAISFLLLFGAMFGDLGQGLTFILCSLILSKSRKGKLRQLGSLVLYCGISSAFFGTLYGSVFGFEEIIPTIWLKPMNNIFKVFKISVIFGMLMITVGIIINIINAMKDKDYLKALFDKSGLIVGMLYWMAIGFLSKSFVEKATVPPIYLTAIFLGFILLFIKPFIVAIFRKKKEKEGVFVLFMESIVDLLEILMNYLANTVSFIRIAAFSLAHAGLFFAIFELSRLLKASGSQSLSLIVIILGNIFIMLLEGLVVSIQSLRLNYYEFFSKFFLTGKQFYTPLTMKGI
jgi:V/A-type H+-transporting ATPase subunit I